MSIEKISFKDPLFRYERLAKKIIGKGKNRVFLYPLPFILFYIFAAFVPHLYVELTNDKILLNFYDDFYVTLGWIPLIVIVSYSFIFYKKTYFESIFTLRRDNVITDNDYVLAIKELTNKKILTIFLIVFEILLNLAWYTDVYSVDQIVLNLRWDVSGLIIAIVIIPIAAEIFTAASTESRLPKMIKDRITIDIFHFDSHGGLRPFGNIMLFYVGIYLATLVVSLLVFEEIRRSFFVLPVFLLIFIVNVYLPQKSLHDKLKEKKQEWLSCLQIQLYRQKDYQNPEKFIENFSNSENKSSSLMALLTLKDQANNLKTISFELVTSYKVLTALLLPLIALLFDFF